MEVVTTSSRRLGRASSLSVGIDVTTRRDAERALARSEEQLRQSQKMDAIGTFAEGISHDFSNLLTGMLCYGNLALGMMSADDPVRNDVSEIRALAVRGTDFAATDGESAIAISRAFPGHIDLLVTNVVMPAMNGRYLSEQLEMMRPGMRVLFVSGDTDDAVLWKGVSLDERALLPKPFTSRELARRVRVMLDQSLRVS